MTISGTQKKQIGILTGGGDAPGYNAVIRGIVTRAISLGYDVLGFRKGWAGLLGDSDHHPLDLDEVNDIHMLGGTILGTSRTNPYNVEGGVEQVRKNLEKHKCDFLISIGGEDTNGVSWKLFKDGINTVGIPKTIDNDVNATDYTFGHWTSVNIAANAIDRLHTTAQSHERVLFVEVMGRHAGWITLHAGMAGGAHIVLIPEEPYDINEICKIIQRREDNGKHYTIVAISEGATPADGTMTTQTGEKDAFGHVRLGGVAEKLAKEVGKRTGKECRHVVLGHLQRAGHPTAFDRILGTRLGVHAVDMIHKKEFGKMSCLKGEEIVSKDMEEALGTLKTVPKHRYEEAKLFFGSY